jgi:precorrin-6B methylase 2
VTDGPFADWVRALEARHLAELTFAEAARALRSLSATYVGRRRQIAEGRVLDGAGKRTAFALFYGPIHHLLVRAIVTSIPDARSSGRTLVDLGCGTGAAGAAWSATASKPPRVLGVDRHPWALEEAARTYRVFGLTFETRRADVSGFQLPKPPVDTVAAFTLNELADAARERMLGALVARARRGDRVLVVEPLARVVAPWWTRWAAAFKEAGGRSDEWRVRVALPPLIQKLDKAAGLDHSELTGRSLWIGSS